MARSDNEFVWSRTFRQMVSNLLTYLPRWVGRIRQLGVVGDYTIQFGIEYRIRPRVVEELSRTPDSALCAINVEFLASYVSVWPWCQFDRSSCSRFPIDWAVVFLARFYCDGKCRCRIRGRRMASPRLIPVMSRCRLCRHGITPDWHHAISRRRHRT